MTKYGLTAAQWRGSSLALRVVALLSLMTYMAACAGLPAWVSQAQQVLPVAVSAVAAILSLVAGLEGKTLDAATVANIQTIANEVNTGIVDIEALVKQYQDHASDGLLSSIQTAANVVVANLQKLMSDAQIKNAETQQKITAIANLVVAELQAWASTLPLLQAKAGAKVTLTVPATVSAFKDSFNAIISTPTGNPDVDMALTHIKHL